jgi:hypothetical protein
MVFLGTSYHLRVKILNENRIMIQVRNNWNTYKYGDIDIKYFVIMGFSTLVNIFAYTVGQKCTIIFLISL